MEPQLLIASLYEHLPAKTTGQHDIIMERREGAMFDTIGVIIALSAMIGIMIAMAIMGDGTSPPPDSMTHLLMSTR